ncbi:hypothetical protein LAPL110952_10730 [Lactiplantibacillus plajomi]
MMSEQLDPSLVAHFSIAPVTGPKKAVDFKNIDSVLIHCVVRLKLIDKTMG